ncbi:MAG: hypothetical protein R3F29_14030 [Planctomycetota bacterium]
MIRVALLSALFAALALPPAFAQKKPGDSPLGKAPLDDPYTDKDEKVMAELGVVSYAPLTWADGLRTTDLEKVLGEGRILWLETPHFRIGSNFGACGAATDPKARKFINEEMAALNKKCSKVPGRKSKLDPWHRLHLYAHRAEQLYSEFAQMVGHTDDKTTLGQKEKFCLLLFAKKSDLARYLDRFCGMKSEQTQRYFFYKSKTYSLNMTLEGEDGPRDEATTYAQFRYFLMQMFADAAGGLPMWLSYGIGHNYERDIPCNMINVGIRADESVDQATQNDWERKISKRAEHPELLMTFLELCAANNDIGYYGHVQAWARVKFLMEDREKFTQFVSMLVKKNGRERQIEALQAVYGWTPEQFDEEWLKWCTRL